MFRKEGNMKMGGFNKFFMLAMSDSVLSCWGEACSHLHVFVIVPFVPARGRNTELLNLQGSWELSVTETPHFSGWWAFARLQTRNSQVFCLLYLHTCRTVRIKPIWLLTKISCHSSVFAEAASPPFLNLSPEVVVLCSIEFINEIYELCAMTSVPSCVMLIMALW